MTKHTPISAASAEALSEDSILADEAIVPVTPRQDGWTPERQRSFIETLADTGCVTTSAQHVGMSPASAYRLRRRTDARAFDAAWDAALERSIERLIPAAIQRALHGTLKQRWYHGEVVGQEHVISERLLLWLLEKGAAMLGNSRARQAMRADWDAALEGVGLAESKAPEPDRPHRVWVDDRRKAWLTDAPPPPGYDGWCRGKPGDPHFARYLQPEEQEALARAEETPQVDPWQDEARRRYFGLDRVRAYVPEDADAWLKCGCAWPPADAEPEEAMHATDEDGPTAARPDAAASPPAQGIGPAPHNLFAAHGRFAAQAPAVTPDRPADADAASAPDTGPGHGPGFNAESGIVLPIPFAAHRPKLSMPPRDLHDLRTRLSHR